MSRRRFVGADVAGAGLPAIPTKTGAQTPAEVAKSREGVFATTLTPQTALVVMSVAKLVTTYTFNGLVPDETWEVLPGDVMRIHLDNRLPPLDAEHADHVDMTRPYQWTTTNVHMHRLHVSPSGDGDSFQSFGVDGHSFDPGRPPYQVRLGTAEEWTLINNIDRRYPDRTLTPSPSRRTLTTSPSSSSTNATC